MKKILSLLGTITLIATSTTSLVSCNTSQYTYSEKELAELKEEKNINIKTSNGEDGVLEWMAPQEKPFNKVDNKWYYVVYRANKNINWQIKKVKNTEKGKNEILFKDKVGILYPAKILSVENYDSKYMKKYFKSVYRWNLDINEPDLIVNNNGNVKVKDE
ncbi:MULTISPECIES: lipoprotein [unclassified Spiroplasma]|uniref:lipoprotein n=1 Tax=unclassified Spiroplasma TaxID=2637901 RepID=UPI0030D4FE89